MKTDNPPAVALSDYQPSAFLIPTVNLVIRLDGKQTRIQATFKVHRNRLQSRDPSTLVLAADGNGPVECSVDGQQAASEQSSDALRIPAPSADSFTVELTTTLDPAANTALSGLYLTNGVYCTQCEAEGFRRIIPFLDRPDVLATYTVTLEAKKADCPVLLCNGNPGEHHDLADGWHSITWHDPHPKPSYLFALVGGQLDVVRDTFTKADGESVDLAIYVEPGKAERATFAMGALKQCITWDEQRFGRLYDLDVFNIVAVSDFNLGAMENKGLNIFNDKYILASPETASDEDYERIDAIIAHEYFHNWSGNRVTCRDWFQLCLKEGLTVFRDQEYTSDLYDRTIKRIHDVRDLWAHQFPEDAGPLAHCVRPDTYREINNFYTATVYEKGAEIVRMIANWLGPVRFREAMDRYFASHDGQAATLEDFLASMEAEASDLGNWPDFIGWYTQAGTPHVDVQFDSDVTGAAATLSFNQHTAPTPGQPSKKPLPIPCKLALIDESASDVPLNAAQVNCEGGRWIGDTFLLEAASGTLRLTGLPKTKLRPSIFRDYSAPVLHTLDGIDHQDRLVLAGNDSNAYSSWAHLQALYSDALQRRYHRIQVGEPLGEDAALFAAIVQKGLCCAINANDLQATRAAAITLPSDHDLARTLDKDVFPDGVEAARASLSRDLCQVHGEALLAAIAETGPVDDGAITPQSAARRALILAMMDHLVAWADPRVDDVINQAHQNAIGMTVRMRTLSMLVKRGTAKAEKALAAFEARFGDDPLVMDKWFGVQARHGDAASVKALAQHPRFDFGNPNRVRSLYGVFAMGNLVGFHAGDGSGYELLGEQLAAIDGQNPQLAARLATAFRTWRTFEPKRQALASAALTNLLSAQGLSPDLIDVLTRIQSG